MQPFSDEAIDALEEEFRRPFKPNPNLDPPLEEYESIVTPRPPPSDRLMNLFDETISTLLEGTPDRTSLFDASRETLIKDLKALGIRSRRRKPRSG
jgi:hypothetical protein